MITFLRKHAQSWLIKILLLVIVVTFIISFGIGTFSNPKEVLVKIGPHEVLVQEYERQYQRELDRLRDRFADKAETLARQLNLRGQVYEQLVNRRLILLSAQKSGLVVSDEEVRDTVRSQPAFQANSRFDANAYAMILRQNGMTPFVFEENTREDLIVQKFQRNLFAGVMVADAELEHRYRIDHEKVAVEYVYVDPARFMAKATASDPEVQTYYDQHKNDYKQPTQFKLRYFVLSTKVLLPSTEVQERAIERYYERNRDTRFTTPGRVHARHILKEFPASGTPEQEQAIRKVLESLRARALAGEDFGKLAKQYSDDPAKAKGGDLGFFKADEMLPAFSEAAFALEPGQISQIVRTSFGFHLIQVLAVEPKVVKPLAAVRDAIVADLKGERAEHRLSLEAERIPQRIEKGGIEAAAAEFKAAVQTTALFDGQAQLPGIGSAEPLVALLRTAKTGDAGVLQRNPVQGHVFYQVLERKDPFIKPLDAVRAAVAGSVREAKAAEAALDTGKSAFKALGTPADFKAFAEKYTLFVKKAEFTASEPTLPELGVNRDFQRAAFGLTAEKPFGISINDRKVYLIHLKRRFMPEGKEAEQFRAESARQIEQELRAYFFNRELERLKSMFPVKLLVPEIVTST